MVSQKEHDKLKTEYNMLLARCRDLEEQLSQKQQQWHDRDIEFNTTEKIMRELCESILAKDQTEMVLGRDYSWSSISINELIRKSKKVFNEYVEKKKINLQKLLDIAEDRSFEIESLTEQIAFMKLNPTNIPLTSEELNKQIEKEKEREEKEEFSGNYKKEDDRPNTEKMNITLTPDDDFESIEDDILTDIARKNEGLKPTPQSIPTTESRKQLDAKLNRKKKAMEAHTINLRDYEDKMDVVSWMVMDAIGTKGISLYNDIENSIFKEKPTITASKIRAAVQDLRSMGMIRKEGISNPLKGALYAHQLTDMGQRMYYSKYHKLPIQSEMDIITAEHDNCNHGYGIKFIAEALRDDGYFKEVNEKNRKNRIKISDGVYYIPDIVCKTASGNTMYIEYECANHTQTNFNSKCNKMCSVTPVLNFVVPNRETMEKIMKQISKWIENRGIKSLTHITVRVNSAAQIRERDLTKNEQWKIVYELSKKAEPICYF